MAFRSDNHKKNEITVFSSPAEKMRIILFSVNDTDISRKKKPSLSNRSQYTKQFSCVLYGVSEIKIARKKEMIISAQIRLSIGSLH